MEAENFKQLFKSGSEAWNHWRRKNPTRVPDLTGIKLKDISIEDYNFSKMNFKLRFFRGSKIRNVDFSFAKLRASTFEDATIIDSNFFKADLSKVNLRNTVLTNCSFYATDIFSSGFNNSVLTNCLFDEETNLLKANFDNASIINSNVEKANINESNIKECEFIGVNKSLLDSLKAEQIEKHIESEKIKREKKRKREADYKNELRKKTYLKAKLDEINHSSELVSNKIFNLEHKLKIKEGYLKAFNEVPNFNKYFNEEIKNLALEIEFQKDEYSKLSYKYDKLKSELFAFRKNNQMLKMSVNEIYDIDIEKPITKSDVEKEFKTRKAKLDLPEPFNKISNNKKNVNIGIYAIDSLEQGTNAIIQIWIYKNKLKKIVSQIAKKFDPNVKETAIKSLFNSISKGDKVTLVLIAHEIEYSETKELFWNGSKACENFLLNVPKELDLLGGLTFSLDIFIEGLPIGNVNFSIAVKSHYSLTKNNIKPIDFALQEYEKAFISYASADRNEVLARIQGLLITEKYKIFLDVINLSGAEKWKPRIYEEIENCDVFFLFWSKQSKESKYVNKEIDFALHCQKGSSINKPRIHPIIIPPIQKPPKKLANLHFNDSITQFILANKQRRKKSLFNIIRTIFSGKSSY